jgi:hypothetical protein
MARMEMRSHCRNWTGDVASCRFGDRCNFQHSDDAVHMNRSFKPRQPNLFSSDTRLAECIEYPLPPKYPGTAGMPRRLCRNWNGSSGSCRYGDACLFLHDNDGPCPPGLMPSSRWNRQRLAQGEGQSDLFRTSSSSSDACPTDGTEYPLSSKDLDSLWARFDFITAKTGATISHSLRKDEVVTIRGSPESIAAAQIEIERMLSELQSRVLAECCVCFEAPPHSGRAYGLLEGCEHVVCFSCAMSWRQNHQVSREARLGCPVCRALTHMIVPYPEAVQGDERLKAIADYKKRCKEIQCKWSTRGERCPAGKHCIFDHSRAPQVIEKPRVISFSELFGDSSDDEDFASFLLEGGIYVYSDSDAESLDFSDQELAEAIAALRRARAGTERARRYPRSQPGRRRRR